MGPTQISLDRLGEVLPFWERDTSGDVTHDARPGLIRQISYRVGRVIHAGPMDSNAASLAWQAALEAAGVGLTTLGKGAEIRLGDCLLTVLHPSLPLPHNAASSNDQSLVVLLQQGRFRLLLTGDAGEAVEKLLASDLIDGCYCPQGIAPRAASGTVPPCRGGPLQ